MPRKSSGQKFFDKYGSNLGVGTIRGLIKEFGETGWQLGHARRVLATRQFDSSKQMYHDSEIAKAIQLQAYVIQYGAPSKPNELTLKMKYANTYWYAPSYHEKYAELTQRIREAKDKESKKELKRLRDEFKKASRQRMSDVLISEQRGNKILSQKNLTKWQEGINRDADNAVKAIEKKLTAKGRMEMQKAVDKASMGLTTHLDALHGGKDPGVAIGSGMDFIHYRHIIEALRKGKPIRISLASKIGLMNSKRFDELARAQVNENWKAIMAEWKVQKISAEAKSLFSANKSPATRFANITRERGRYYKAVAERFQRSVKKK